MASDIYETVHQGDSCARNRITEKKHTNVMKLFPASRFFGRWIRYRWIFLDRYPNERWKPILLVIADWFKKVTITVPLRILTASAVAKAFCDRLVHVYGPIFLLTDNGPQFTAKFF
jgi:hypothetical protein